MGLPFSFVIFFVMAGLYKSLKVEDYRRASASRETAPYLAHATDRLTWKKRLSRLMNYPALALHAEDDGRNSLPRHAGSGERAGAARS
ncbi:hypothetical protein WDV93_00590 [Pantoea ananatis]